MRRRNCRPASEKPRCTPARSTAGTRSRPRPSPAHTPATPSCLHPRSFPLVTASVYLVALEHYVHDLAGTELKPLSDYALQLLEVEVQRY